MSTPAIETEQLTRRFGGLAAVDGIDLTVEEGEIYAFLGPNGAGKTTAVRMLVTLLAPSEGRARVRGIDVVDAPHDVRLQIGVALQDAALDGKQTGRELLRLQGRLYGLDASTIRRRLEEVESLIDIGDAINRPIDGYSGGMRRRVDLAAALMHEPRVLFLDEPTTGLDPVSRTRVWEEVRRLNRELGMTIFLTTQYLEEADELADRVGIIDRGEIVAEGTPAELKRGIGADLVVVRSSDDLTAAVDGLASLDGVERVDPHDDELTIVTRDGARVLAGVVRALEDAGVTPEELVLRTPTLDDVFLDVTGNRMEHDTPAAAGEEAEQ